MKKYHQLIDYYVPVILVLTAFIWKFFFIDYRDICNDEPFTIFHAQKSLSDIIKISMANEATPPLFMILTHFWIKLFGIGPYSVRFLPLIFNALTVLFIYWTGKRYFGFWAGLIASGMFLLSNYHFFYGLEARTYSLMSLATAASLYYFLRFAENQQDRKALAGLIVSNIVLVYSHHFGWFVIFSQLIAGLFYTRSLKSFLKFLIPPVATVVAFTPMIVVIVRQFLLKASRGTWLNPPKSEDYLRELYYFLNNYRVYRLVLIVIGAGILFTLIMLVLKKRKTFDKGIIMLFLWWIIPYSIMFFVSSKVPMFNNRYILFNTIGLYLFAGAAITYLFREYKFIAPLMGIAILATMAYHIRILPKDFGYREISNAVNYVKSADSDNRVIILYPFWSDYQFNYYYKQNIYKDYRNTEELMRQDGIYKIWGVRQARQIVAANPGKRVIYLQDGPIKASEGLVFSYLDSVLVRRDSVHFPQTFHVGVFDPF